MAVHHRPTTTRPTRQPAAASPDPGHREAHGGFFESSHDLLKGSEVIEDAPVLDDELFEALFPKSRPKPP